VRRARKLVEHEQLGHVWPAQRDEILMVGMGAVVSRSASEATVTMKQWV
jgi:hypothetical protein